MFLRRFFFLVITLPVCFVGSVLLIFPLARCTTDNALIGETASDSFLRDTDDTPKGGDLQILAQSGQSDGLRLQDIPVWLSTYIRSGTRGLEALPDYGENYAFLIENQVTSLSEIRTWVSACNPMKALSFLVARRVKARLSEVMQAAPPREGASLPDAAAEFLSAVGDAFYGGAKEINRWWIQSKNAEFRGYIFLVMDQEMLDRQIQRLMVDNNFTFTQEEREIWMQTRF